MRDGVRGWRKSVRCECAACVEVSTEGGDVLMRDSKDPDGVVLEFSAKEWRAFCVSAREGRTGQTAVDVLRLDVGVEVARGGYADRVLKFTTEEWDTFMTGVVSGEFDDPVAAATPLPLLIVGTDALMTEEDLATLREAFEKAITSVEACILRGVTSVAYIPAKDRK